MISLICPGSLPPRPSCPFFFALRRMPSVIWCFRLHSRRCVDPVDYLLSFVVFFLCISFLQSDLCSVADDLS